MTRWVLTKGLVILGLLLCAGSVMLAPLSSHADQTNITPEPIACTDYYCDSGCDWDHQSASAHWVGAGRTHDAIRFRAVAVIKSQCGRIASAKSVRTEAV